MSDPQPFRFEGQDLTLAELVSQTVQAARLSYTYVGPERQDARVNEIHDALVAELVRKQGAINTRHEQEISVLKGRLNEETARLREKLADRRNRIAGILEQYWPGTCDFEIGDIAAIALLERHIAQLVEINNRGFSKVGGDVSSANLFAAGPGVMERDLLESEPWFIDQAGATERTEKAAAYADIWTHFHCAYNAVQHRESSDRYLQGLMDLVEAILGRKIPWESFKAQSFPMILNAAMAERSSLVLKINEQARMIRTLQWTLNRLGKQT